jgi:hypothetical protein
MLVINYEYCARLNPLKFGKKDKFLKNFNWQQGINPFTLLRTLSFTLFSALSFVYFFGSTEI